MNFDENAEIVYQPEEAGIPDLATPMGQQQRAFDSAERQAMRLPGVNGVGRGQTPGGAPALVVYLANSQARATLPATLEGLPVVGEVVGEVRPLDSGPGS